jgi:hypothetical protein
MLEIGKLHHCSAFFAPRMGESLEMAAGAGSFLAPALLWRRNHSHLDYVKYLWKLFYNRINGLMFCSKIRMVPNWLMLNHGESAQESIGYSTSQAIQQIWQQMRIVPIWKNIYRQVQVLFSLWFCQVISR